MTKQAGKRQVKLHNATSLSKLLARNTLACRNSLFFIFHTSV